MSYKFSKNLTTVNRTVNGNKNIAWIVIHYTGNKTDSAAGNANYFKSENRGASAHYFVDAANVVQVVEDKDAAWAVGKNYGKNNLYGICTNHNSISIEMCSSGGRVLDSTFENTANLTKELMKKYGIDPNHVVRHFDVCSKSCPGWSGWLPSNESLWNKFKNAISAKEETGGWQHVGDTWYYADINGKRVTNSWKKIKSATTGKYYWYYFDNLGKMQKDWFQTPDGTWYYAQPNGDLEGALWKSNESGGQYIWSEDI